MAARALHFGESPSAAIRESRAAHSFTRGRYTMASDQRMRGRLDQARQTADRFFGFAQLLVQRNPNDPMAYLVLADAYDQLHKNAWQVLVRPAIERNLRRSIEANRHALDLAPYDELARQEMDRRQRKLEGLLHPDRGQESPVRQR